MAHTCGVEEVKASGYVKNLCGYIRTHICIYVYIYICMYVRVIQSPLPARLVPATARAQSHLYSCCMIVALLTANLDFQYHVDMVDALCVTNVGCGCKRPCGVSVFCQKLSEGCLFPSSLLLVRIVEMAISYIWYHKFPIAMLLRAIY